MDSDIRVNLKEVGNLMHALARQLESPNVNLEALQGVNESLTDIKRIIDTYCRIQKERYFD